MILWLKGETSEREVAGSNPPKLREKGSGCC